MVGVSKPGGHQPWPRPCGHPRARGLTCLCNLPFNSKDTTSIPREMFEGDILRRLLATFPSLFGLLPQVLQQEGSIWHRVGTLRFSLHWRKLRLQFEMGESKQIQSLRPTYSFSYLSHKSPSCWYGQCVNSEYPVWLMPIFCHSCIII